MSSTPKSINDKITNLALQWKTLAPTVSFGDSTLDEFNTLVKPSLDARAEIAQLESQIENQIKLRDQADKVSYAEVGRIGRSVHDHKQFGANSGLYKALGFVTDDERASGLHRGGTPAAPAAPAGAS